MEVSASRFGRVTPRKETLSARRVGGWEGPGSGLEAVAMSEISDLAGNGTPAVQTEPPRTQCVVDEAVCSRRAPVWPVVAF